MLIYLHTYHWKTLMKESNARHVQFWATAKCFKSFLYLLLSPPFGEEICPTEKMLFGSLLCVQNDLPFVLCQDGLQIAMWLEAGHNHAALLIPVPWTARNTYVVENV